MSLDPVALVERYHAALNAYDAATVAPMFAEGAVYLSPGVNGRLEGREQIIAAFSAYFSEHADQQAVDEKIERVAPMMARSRWRLRATAASTGQPVQRRGSETVTFGDDGLILRVEVQDEC
jgi:uncharacterized protein (TIGR02246 family)